MSSGFPRIDNLSLAVVAALAVAGFVFLDPASLAQTLVGGTLLLLAALTWWLAARR